MIIMQLMGGMGNQMFQYAFGRSLSLKYNVPLKLDLSILKRRDFGPDFVYRDYDLDLFNVFADFDINMESKVHHLSEPHFHFSEKSLNYYESIDGDLSIYGYWQSPKYFAYAEEIIRKDFQFRDTVSGPAVTMMAEIRATNSVVINVRRTDYLNTDFHGVMGLEYIMAGVEIIRSKIKNPHFFIFSDDIDWCRENIRLDNMTIVDHQYKGDRFGNYLQLMKACKHYIIPNSTFAWWGAWLNDNPDKIVITPAKWFADPNLITADLIPVEWLRI
jgi:hypothetical protein